jgi:hypothetical protein
VTRLVRLVDGSSLSCSLFPYPLLMMTRLLQDPDLPARFPMGITGSRDEDGAGMAYVRCNDGTIWLDTGEQTVPWRRLPAIPELTAEEVEAVERVRRAALEEGMTRDRENARAELVEAVEIQRREMETTQRLISWHLRPWWRRR